MNRRSGVLAIAMAVMTIWPIVALAHNGIEHVLGTITAVTDSSITVETVKHTSVNVKVDSSTTFTNSTGKSSLKELKVGDRVAINAKEGADRKLQAVTVKRGASVVSH